MNPVPIMKLVEIIKGYSTSKETFDAILKCLKLWKSSCKVNDYPGLWRINSMPMINEAILKHFYNGFAGCRRN